MSSYRTLVLYIEIIDLFVHIIPILQITDHRFPDAYSLTAYIRERVPEGDEVIDKDKWTIWTALKPS